MPKDRRSLWLGIWIAFFLLIACSIVVIVKRPSIAQTLTYNPSPVGAFVNSGSGWTEWAAGSGLAQLTYTPSPVGLYCNSGTGWTPCNPVTGGSPYNPAAVAITGGTINGTTIGLTIPAAADFTSINGVSGTEEVVTPSATPAFSSSTISSIITLTANVTSYTLANGLYGGEQHTITWCEGAGGFTVTGIPANIRGAFNPFPSTTANTCSTQAYKWSPTMTVWFAVSAGSVNQ